MVSSCDGGAESHNDVVLGQYFDNHVDGHQQRLVRCCGRSDVVAGSGPTTQASDACEQEVVGVPRFLEGLGSPRAGRDVESAVSDTNESIHPCNKTAVPFPALVTDHSPHKEGRPSRDETWRGAPVLCQLTW